MSGRMALCPPMLAGQTDDWIFVDPPRAMFEIRGLRAERHAALDVAD